MPLISSVAADYSLWENVYYSASNLRKTRTPCINSQIVKTVFPNMSIQGGQVSVDLPMGPILSHCQITLAISATLLNNLRAANIPVYLAPGWGYRAIQNYQIQTGGSTQLRVYQNQLFMQLFQDCETGDKRQAALQLGGPEYTGGADLTEDLIAYVHIYLPWSNISAQRFIGFDSGLNTKPFTLLFEFSSPDQLFTYPQGNRAAITSNVNYPNAYTKKYLTIQTALMALGPSESIRPAVSALGSGQYNYPWMYPGPFISSPFIGMPASGNQKQTVTLNQFQNGNLQSITLMLKRVTAGVSIGTPAADVPINNSANNIMEFEDMTNIEVKYAGQVVFRSDDSINKLMNLSETAVENTIKISVPNWSNTVLTAGQSYNVQPHNSSWVLVNFVQQRQSYMQNLLQDGVSLLANLLTVEFNTPELASLTNGTNATAPQPVGVVVGDVVKPTTQPQYVLMASYNYQAAVNCYKSMIDMQFLPSNAQGPYTMAS